MNNGRMQIDEILESWTDSRASTVATARAFGREVVRCYPSRGLPMFMAGEEMVRLYRDMLMSGKSNDANVMLWAMVSVYYPNESVGGVLQKGGLLNVLAKRRAQKVVLDESQPGRAMARLPRGWRRDSTGVAYFEAGFRGDSMARGGTDNRPVRLWVLERHASMFWPVYFDDLIGCHVALDGATDGRPIGDVERLRDNCHRVMDAESGEPLGFTCEWPAVAFVRSIAWGAAKVT